MRGDRPLLEDLESPWYVFTPHARGSTYGDLEAFRTLFVYPACAGIDPEQKSPLYPPARLPRMRGDRPVLPLLDTSQARFTPHARGSTHSPSYPARWGRVYPACAGIDRERVATAGPPAGLPRMRGDRPPVTRSYRRKGLFTPHARGSTCNNFEAGHEFQVYPACAGIDPMSSARPSTSLSLPRMRGDRPFFNIFSPCPTWFTPHARGSTWPPPEDADTCQVYPACAGIDPSFLCLTIVLIGLPRMRGDRPATLAKARRLLGFTPHARGSTASTPRGAMTLWVYPACAGIDPALFTLLTTLRCLPRMRGDRPSIHLSMYPVYSFTPHARGSTQLEELDRKRQEVYPACAGIDPRRTLWPPRWGGLPRMRGDRPLST